MESQAPNNENIIFKKIKLLLVERNMQFKELAEHVGMTPQGLRVSLKRNKVSFETVRKIAYYLSTTAQYLADDSKITSSAPIKSQKRIEEEIKRAEEPLLSQLDEKMDQLYKALLKIGIYEKIIKHFISRYPDDPVSKLFGDKIGLYGFGLREFKEFEKELDKVLSE